MAKRVKRKRFQKLSHFLQETLPGQCLTACVYAIMLILVLMFFTGHGAFIYENF